MSEQATAASAPPRGGGRKVLGMSQGQLLIVLGVALVGGAFLLWRSRKSKAAASQQTTSACPDGSQPDANGNCVQSGQDWSGQIGTLQTEIADLQGALSGAGGGGGSGTVGGSTGTTTIPGGTDTGTGGTTGTGGGGGGGSAFKAAGAISNLQQTGRTGTSVSIRWNPVPGATGYAYKLTQLNGVVKASGTTKSTSFSAGGLHPKWTYNFGVQALPGGAGNNIHVGTT